MVGVSPVVEILIAPSVGLFKANKTLWIFCTSPSLRKCSSRPPSPASTNFKYKFLCHWVRFFVWHP